MNETEDPRADLAFTSVPGLVAAAAARFGDAEALVDGDLRLSFSGLEAGALRVTAAAMAAGIQPGDRIAIWAPNMAEWVLAALGLLGTGAVLVPLNTRFKGPEAAFVLNRSGAKALFTVRGFLGIDYPAMLEEEDIPGLERIVLLRDDDEGTLSEPTTTDEVPIFGWSRIPGRGRRRDRGRDDPGGPPPDHHEVMAAWRAVGPDDLSDIIFTSGTTGRPKGAMTTHAQTLRTFATWAAIVGLAEGDRYLIVNPFFHTFGYKAGIVACLIAGATIVPEPVFDVDRVLEKVAAEQITVLPGPPTLYQSILDHPRRAAHDLSSLRLAVTGAAAVPVELVLRMRVRAHLLHRPHRLRPHRVHRGRHDVPPGRRPRDHRPHLGPGHPRDRGPDRRRRPVAPSPPGSARGRSSSAATRWSPATSRTPRPRPRPSTPTAGSTPATSVSWTRPGNVRITDRKKDMFIVGGFNAYPAEIEGALLRHPGVSQVAVVGVPDARLGEVGCAFVVPRPDADPTALARELLVWARERMANYKVPRVVEIVEALPLNARGRS